MITKELLKILDHFNHITFQGHNTILMLIGIYLSISLILVLVTVEIFIVKRLTKITLFMFLVFVILTCLYQLETYNIFLSKYGYYKEMIFPDFFDIGKTRVPRIKRKFRYLGLLDIMDVFVGLAGVSNLFWWSKCVVVHAWLTAEDSRPGVNYDPLEYWSLIGKKIKFSKLVQASILLFFVGLSILICLYLYYKYFI